MVQALDWEEFDSGEFIVMVRESVEMRKHGDDEIRSSWILRYVLGLDTRGLKISLCYGRSWRVVRLTWLLRPLGKGQTPSYTRTYTSAVEFRLNFFWCATGGAQALSSFFRNVDNRYDPPTNLPVGDGRGSIRALKARAVLVDMEEGVVNDLLKGPLAELFDDKQFITGPRARPLEWEAGGTFGCGCPPSE